jgi:hypothetical protein
MSLSTLPRDIQKSITEDLSYVDIISLCSTQKSLYTLCQEKSFWQSLISRRWPEYKDTSEDPRDLFRLLSTHMRIIFPNLTFYSPDYESAIAALIFARLLHLRTLPQIFSPEREIKEEELWPMLKMYLVPTNSNRDFWILRVYDPTTGVSDYPSQRYLPLSGTILKNLREMLETQGRELEITRMTRYPNRAKIPMRNEISL